MQHQFVAPHQLGPQRIRDGRGESSFLSATPPRPCASWRVLLGRRGARSVGILLDGRRAAVAVLAPAHHNLLLALLILWELLLQQKGVVPTPGRSELQSGRHVEGVRLQGRHALLQVQRGPPAAPRRPPRRPPPPRPPRRAPPGPRPAWGRGQTCHRVRGGDRQTGGGRGGGRAGGTPLSPSLALPLLPPISRGVLKSPSAPPAPNPGARSRGRGPSRRNTRSARGR